MDFLRLSMVNPLFSGAYVWEIHSLLVPRYGQSKVFWRLGAVNPWFSAENQEIVRTGALPFAFPARRVGLLAFDLDLSFGIVFRSLARSPAWRPPRALACPRGDVPKCQ